MDINEIIKMDINEISQIIQNITIIIASGVAIYGINSWRREAKWKRKYEVAEETLALFYEIKDIFSIIKDIFSIIRSPFGNLNEGKTRKKGKNEDEKETKILDQAYVVIERYEKYKEPFYKLQAIKYRFITLFGKENERYFNDISKLINKIIFASHLLGDLYLRNSNKHTISDTEYRMNVEEIIKNQKIIYRKLDKDDEIDKELEKIIKGIEKVCYNVISKK